MKSLFTTFLLISFVGVAVFGFIGMSHSSMHDREHGCIAATFDGRDCKDSNLPFENIFFHINIFKSFSEALLYGLGILTIILLVFISWFSGIRRGDDPPLVNLYILVRHYIELLPFSFKRKLTYWLLFHDNSPSIF